MQKTVLKKSVTAMDKELKSGYRKYTFSEEGILLKSEVSEGNTAWTLYKDWEIYGNYICIRNLSNENVLVKQDKLSAEERTCLLYTSLETLEALAGKYIFCAASNGPYEPVSYTHLDRHNRDMLINSDLLGVDGTAQLIEEVAGKVFQE